MNRLDDEIRNAFRREQPPAEFTARVLQRIALQPAPRPRWWQRLATLLEPPKLRWMAIGMTATLLLAIGATQYSKLHRAVINDSTSVAQAPPTVETPNTTKENDRPKPESVAVKNPRIGRRDSSIDHQLAVTRYRKREQLRAEGEAAKQKLMLALSIASTTLNNAERAIRDEGPTP
jgi:hypothetical protein